jgi:hypothetical protein
MKTIVMPHFKFRLSTILWVFKAINKGFFVSPNLVVGTLFLICWINKFALVITIDGSRFLKDVVVGPLL